MLDGSHIYMKPPILDFFKILKNHPNSFLLI
jgi:hypothetical protein